MVASIIGSFTVRSSGSASSHDLARALHMGTNVAMGITIVGTVVLAAVMFGGTDEVDNWWGVAVSVIGGLLVGFGIGKVAEIWTSDHYSPVKKIAAQAETGPATTILGGISAGMVSVAASVILIVVAIAVAYWGGEQMAEGLGIYGIAIAAIGMLATTGVVVSVDAYGPIADNAGGIAEMAELDPSVREVTDALDSLGNTTAAVAKGFAVGSAAITALALFKSFEAAMLDEGHILDLNVGDVTVFIGLFIGAMLPFLFAALTIDAVGRAANKMIEEVRRQFREIPGLREGNAVARLGPLRGDLHPGFAARDARPGRSRGRSSSRRSALSTSTRSAGSSPVRSSPAFVSGDLHGKRRWRLGQRQEVHRGRSSWRQGLGAPQGRSGRRHRRRPVQGHRGPVDEHPDQGDDGRVADLRFGLPDLITSDPPRGLVPRFGTGPFVVSAGVSRFSNTIG